MCLNKKQVLVFAIRFFGSTINLLIARTVIKITLMLAIIINIKVAKTETRFLVINI